MNVPTFETERLILREVAETDEPTYAKNFVDYEVIRHLTRRVPWPYPENGVIDYMRTQILPKQGIDKWVWAIRLKTNPDEVIGAIDVWREGNPENRGFWLGRKYWGQGLMTETVTPVMDYAFDHLGFEKMVFTNALGNTKSRRVKEKTGARLIAVKPAEFVDPTYTEHEIWELNKEDWHAFRTRQKAAVAANQSFALHPQA